MFRWFLLALRRLQNLLDATEIGLQKRRKAAAVHCSHYSSSTKQNVVSLMEFCERVCCLCWNPAPEVFKTANI